MSTPLRVGLLTLAFLALGALMWLHAARALMPFPWPPLPFAPETMSVPEILLTFGLMPRGVMALLVGATLGLCGALLQAVLRNPVADPTVLGISAGAQLALVTATLQFPALLALGRGPVAFAGATLAAAFVLAIGARRGFAPVTVAIGGMLVGMFASALATAMTLSEGHYLLSLVIWNGGSLVQQDWSGVRHLGLTFAVACALAAVMARPLRVLSIGAEGARGLGLGVGLIRFLVTALAVWLAAAIAAEVGMVAFVGLAAPAFARVLGARGPAQLLLASAPLGAAFLSFCDGLVLLVGAHVGEMFPTGALTGLIGGPLLLWLLPRLRGSTPPGTEAGDGPARRRPRPWRLLAGIGAGLALATLAVLAIGRLPGGWAVLDPASFAQFLPLRLPRLVAALAAGGLLAIAGTLLQRLTANPLASPEVMGVSGGAALGYAAAVFLFPGASKLALVLLSAGGGAVALILLAGYVLGRDMPAERVLLAGIAVSALASAVLSAIMATGDARSWKILAWLAGSSGSVTAGGAAALAAAAALALGAALAMRRWLTLLPLGPSIPEALGMPRRAARLGPILVAGLATGAASVLVGPLSFVGLMAPHIARRLGFAQATTHLVAAFLIGAALMLAADFGARVASFPYELPLGLFATLLGAPWLTWLMTRRPRA
ncbi:MAG: Fe(3+)-hydroxamate ABC transporter permease FhuB [Rhodovulum sulfidophilum]|uniref:Fe(3+)-hydroxamate ABC transporter permease FhuB n=1 Tax=Rhodovulum sulfidophilum TaxID=35806 RepID=A0A2W5PRL5_RHOSU|nr:MAG: Fe(3+)-hydroxamate ABC transporter permease FhuB [Rhodovulum sulfidophilum]